jgi:hypothetical protein
MEIDAYAASLLEEAAQGPANTRASSAVPPQDVLEAIEQLKAFGKNHSLSVGSMTIRQLRHEARPRTVSLSTPQSLCLGAFLTNRHGRRTKGVSVDADH